MTNSIITLPNNVVSITDNQIKTTSLKVAEHFGKRHDNILRAVNSLDCSPEFNALNFEAVEYADLKGEKRQSYEMTKDGFMFLVMGFTGKKAAAIKEAYINAFNKMAEQLQAQTTKHTLTPAQQHHVQKLVTHLAHMPGNSFASVYRSIKDKYNVGSYKDIAATRYGDLCHYLGGEPLQGEYIPKVSASEALLLTSFY